MSETAIEGFYTQSATLENVISVMEAMGEEKNYDLAYAIGNHFCRIFPRHHRLLELTAIAAEGTKKYSIAYDLYTQLVNQTIKQSLIQKYITQQQAVVKHIVNDYNFYPKDIILSLCRKMPNPLPLITFTITTCKRFDLFEQTMNSFLNCCTDVEKIDSWFCVDDNSSEEDREKMKSRYPFFTFYLKTKEEKGHPQSMNIIQREVKTPFIFHMEDDWKFYEKRAYLTECLDVLSSAPNICQCLLNRNYAEVPADVDIIGGVWNSTASGTVYVVHEHTKNNTEQQQFLEKYRGGKNCSYWPHYSLRASLLRSSVLREVGQYDEKVSHFEMDYAYKVRDKGYISAFLPGIYCMHIGRLTCERHDNTKLNAYVLNDEKQFSGKEAVKEAVKEMKEMKETNEKEPPVVPQKTPLPIYTVNLERRPDRWKSFQAHNIPCVRYNAVDGNSLHPTEQLQRIFEGNDYNMKSGIVGCALSHIKLYTEFVQGKLGPEEVICVLEDDARPTDDFLKKLESLLTLLSAVEFDMCYLGHHLWKQYRTPQIYNRTTLPSVEKWNTAKSLKYSMGGTAGYIITRKGAERLLNFINERGMTNGIDTVQQKAADTLNIYYCTPHLIFADCWEPDEMNEKLDSDIQSNNAMFLTIPPFARLQNERAYYKQMSECVDEGDLRRNIQQVSGTSASKAIVYRGNIPDDLKAVPHYPLDCLWIFVPKPTEQILKDKCFERLKKNGIWNISEALYSRKNMHIIPFGDMSHVYEAIGQPATYPFDTIDEGDIVIFSLLTELILNLDDEKIAKFVANKLCNPDGNETYVQSWNNRTVLKNKSYRITFPHEDIKDLVSIYTERFKTLRDHIKSDNPIYLINAQRWYNPNITPQTFYYLYDMLSKYNKNVHIFTINGIDPNSPIEEKYKNVITAGISNWPEHLRMSDWPEQKIQYDQKTFKLEITALIQKFLQN